MDAVRKHIARCKPTYEGLKADHIEQLAGIRPRCKPTYEGLKGAVRKNELDRACWLQAYL